MCIKYEHIVKEQYLFLNTGEVGGGGGLFTTRSTKSRNVKTVSTGDGTGVGEESS